MAYNYPNYQYPYYQTQQSGIIWVQGESGAKSYMVAPNQTVQLWDSEAQTLYLKSADAYGMPSMKVLDYTIRETAQAVPKVAAGEYVTREELQSLREEIFARLKGEQHEPTLPADERHKLTADA